MSACFYGCGRTEDLRPYGPGGEPVCFPCATSPEHNDVTQRSMTAVIEGAAAISPVGGIVLDVDGFHPATGESPPPGAVVRDITMFVRTRGRLPRTPDEVDRAQQ